MKCPYCGCKETKVTDSRESNEEPVTRRRRECPKCKKRFTTYERLETSNVIVVKKDGRREQFDREKLRRGLLRACEKRPISSDKIDSVISDMESDITSSGKTEVASRLLGEKVMSALKKLDKVAYIRFASVYREFTDLETFQEELKTLLKKQRGKR
ncbi:MAG: transcriptional regulator NrdR [Candidatus Nanoarchaeia archaeon]|nr:transcriptional regulator NrdR [Candidatus Nanoarchaeia archaeon]